MTVAASRPARGLRTAVVAAAVLLTGFLVAPADSRAARGMELAIQDDSLFVQGHKRFEGDRAFDYARALGVSRIRVNLLWAYTMPESQYNARRKPGTVNYNFTQIDQLIDRAAANGMRVHLSLTGPAPRWANARRRLPTSNRAWYKPNARQYGEFADVVANHFRGRVDRYSIWNEPNYKTWLGPLKAAPRIYRSMYVRAYRAIKKADRRAQVLIGETSPYSRRGRATSPLAFLRKVTCVNRRYRRVRRCARLKADGYAHHPYDFTHTPRFQFRGSDNVTIGTLSRLTRALDRLRRSGALRRTRRGRMPVYLTEYGYFASGRRAVSPRKRSRYLKQAYSIALRNRRVKSQLQYLLLVLPRRSQSTFNTGLVSRSGRRLPQYRALRSWYRANRRRVKRPRPFTLPPAPPNPSR
ncbi:MAG: cellulase family glycosylhydrolase [Thermoleophilaceae bacterium]